ncbi:MAG: hypothetical protein U0L47_07350 [Paludibacteraceae bacterium]|nr:hypothetical protein [Paludibacteraceae bacterium]
MFTTPILLITFNRPDHVHNVLTEIRKLQPASLYVCQDGTREGNLLDAERIQEVRNVINELVDWPCELHTLYQGKNLGCGPGPAAGISWFFEQVDMGIIIEDDCLPHPDFFAYCEDMLNRYNNNPNVRFINATLYHDRWQCEASYGFSRYMVTGAWAAWRETWQGFDIDMHTWNAWQFRKQVKRLTDSTNEANWWYWKLKEIQADTSKKSYWDYQMQMHLFKNDAITIHPKNNLISNIGFDAEGTHTLSNDGRGDRKVYPILPLVHPGAITINNAMDVDCFGKTQPQSVCKNVVQFVYQYMLHSNGMLHAMLMVYKKMKGKS